MIRRIARAWPTAWLIGAAACGRLAFDNATPAQLDGRTPDAADATIDAAPEIDARAPDDAASSGPIPIHEYRFENNLADERGGPTLVGLGGAFTADGYRFAANQGVVGALTLPPSVYTVDITFAFDTLASWRKILDFKGLGSDNGLYTFDTSLQFVVVAGSVFATSPPVLATATSARATLSRDAAGHVIGSVDGIPLFNFDDTDGVATLDASQSATFFIDDQVTGSGEASAGVVRRIRIYDAALNAGALGP